MVAESIFNRPRPTRFTEPSAPVRSTPSPAPASFAQPSQVRQQSVASKEQSKQASFQRVAITSGGGSSSTIPQAPASFSQATVTTSISDPTQIITGAKSIPSKTTINVSPVLRRPDLARVNIQQSYDLGLYGKQTRSQQGLIELRGNRNFTPTGFRETSRASSMDFFEEVLGIKNLNSRQGTAARTSSETGGASRLTPEEVLQAREKLEQSQLERASFRGVSAKGLLESSRKLSEFGRKQAEQPATTSGQQVRQQGLKFGAGLLAAPQGIIEAPFVLIPKIKSTFDVRRAPQSAELRKREAAGAVTGFFQEPAYTLGTLAGSGIISRGFSLLGSKVKGVQSPKQLEIIDIRTQEAAQPLFLPGEQGRLIRTGDVFKSNVRGVVRDAKTGEVYKLTGTITERQITPEVAEKSLGLKSTGEAQLKLTKLPKNRVEQYLERQGRLPSTDVVIPETQLAGRAQLVSAPILDQSVARSTLFLDERGRVTKVTNPNSNIFIPGEIKVPREVFQARPTILESFQPVFRTNKQGTAILYPRVKTVTSTQPTPLLTPQVEAGRLFLPGSQIFLNFPGAKNPRVFSSIAGEIRGIDRTSLSNLLRKEFPGQSSVPKGISVLDPDAQFESVRVISARGITRDFGKRRTTTISELGILEEKPYEQLRPLDLSREQTKGFFNTRDFLNQRELEILKTRFQEVKLTENELRKSPTLIGARVRVGGANLPSFNIFQPQARTKTSTVFQQFIDTDLQFNPVKIKQTAGFGFVEVTPSRTAQKSFTTLSLASPELARAFNPKSSSVTLPVLKFTSPARVQTITPFRQSITFKPSIAQSLNFKVSPALATRTSTRVATSQSLRTQTATALSTGVSTKVSTAVAQRTSLGTRTALGLSTGIKLDKLVFFNVRSAGDVNKRKPTGVIKRKSRPIKPVKFLPKLLIGQATLSIAKFGKATPLTARETRSELSKRKGPFAFDLPSKEVLQYLRRR